MGTKNTNLDLIETDYYSFSKEKEKFLNEQRKISFNDIIEAITEDGLIDIIPNKNYKKQEMFIVKINKYVYVVPFEVRNNRFHLITVWPSSKAKKQYLKEGGVLYEN